MLPRRPDRDDLRWMRRALALARRGQGCTSPNPTVGAVLVKRGRLVGQGWHRKAGEPHAEIEAILNARRLGHPVRGSTLYVTLEPCSTHGRTPACTESIIAAGIRRVVAGAADPNPAHAGRAFRILHRAGIQVTKGLLAKQCSQLNEAFNHWIVHRTPFVTLKTAMTLDGKIATADGESKWITGSRARAAGMRLRRHADAILVGVNTVLMDNPRLTRRSSKNTRAAQHQAPLSRVILDTRARTPLNARVVTDEFAGATTIVVGRAAPRKRVAALAARVRVLTAPTNRSGINLKWLMKRLGAEGVTHLLVEGGGEVTASFIHDRLAHRVSFFVAPKILGGRNARHAVAGPGATDLSGIARLTDIRWRRCGIDLLLTARVAD